MNSTDSYLYLLNSFPPSEACSCETCRNYCKRPGWWTVEEARMALSKGMAYRMMLEISPERNFGVLSPAFRGNGGSIALQIFSANGCTFLKNDLCELFGTGLQPLECRFCHHNRMGRGSECHFAIESDWKTSAGQQLVDIWIRQMRK